MLSDLAIHEPAAFEAIVEKAKAALPAARAPDAARLTGVMPRFRGRRIARLVRHPRCMRGAERLTAGLARP